ncbi:MAG: ATP-binding cassette domain-containing protein [Chloroflexota bacterium]
MNSNPTIETQNLTRQFGQFTAVDHVTFAVHAGEIFGFLGPNGSGKTTTIRMLCGLLSPSEGTARVLGYDAVRQVEEYRPHIGYMSQRFSLYPDLTVHENIEFYAGVYRVAGVQKRARIAELIGMAGLSGREGELARNLSGGWRQRLALGCAMVHRPRLLFLDEPTAGVDPVSRRDFWDLIYELADDGVTVFVTTHYMDEAEHCHRIGLMHAGRLIACDAPSRLKASSITGRLLDVRCHPLDLALSLLRKHPRIDSATLYGAAIHAVVSEQVSPEVVSAYLSEQGVKVERLTSIKPSMEDTFVALVGAASPDRQSNNGQPPSGNA